MPLQVGFPSFKTPSSTLSAPSNTLLPDEGLSFMSVVKCLFPTIRFYQSGQGCKCVGGGRWPGF